VNAPEKLHLPDVQSTPDQRQLAIQRVGVRGLRYPLKWVDEAGQVQHTFARLEMTVALPPEVKGTHMSRFVELLEAETGPVDLARLGALATDMLTRLDAREGRIELEFPFFLRKAAPVSGVESLLDMDARIVVEKRGDVPASIELCVVVPVTSLCPCSRKISAYGAHNQRSHLTLSAVLREDMSLETLVRIAEEEASCAVFGLLKRPDEKWVTERAYDNPKFVEDLVRDVALRLKAESRIARWSIASENFESIHNHSAYALIEGHNA